MSGPDIIFSYVERNIFLGNIHLNTCHPLRVEISPFSPKWSEDQVVDWLETLKEADKLNFDVDNVRMRGARFNDLAKSDLKELTGNTKAGIIIFNAKENHVHGFDFSGKNADEYLQIIKALADEKELPMRDNRTYPGPRFAANTFRSTWDRKTLISEAITYFNGAPAAKRGVHNHTGMLATLASRGSGKSHLVDELCRLGSDKRLFDGSKKFCLVPVPISFNGPQEYDNVFFPDSKSNVIARVMHHGLFDASLVNWSTFLGATRRIKWESMDISILFKCMITFFAEMDTESSPVILFAIDELTKCGGMQTAQEMMKPFKVLLSDYPNKCRLFVTTFDDLFLRDRRAMIEDRRVTTGSERPVSFLVCEPLKNMFHDDKAKRIFKEKHLSNSGVLDDHSVDHLLALTAGHPRSLELLKTTFDECTDTTVTYADIFKTWFDKFRSYSDDNYPDYEVMLHLLSRALLNEQIKLKDDINGTTVKELIRQTVVLNGVDPRSNFVPQLSPMVLQHWSGPNNPKRTPIQRRLSRLLELGRDLDWVRFEEFHLIFEELRCWAYHTSKKSTATTTHTLQTWFEHGEFLNEGENIEINIPKPTFNATVVLQKHIGELDGTIDSICLAKSGQPGMDVMQPMGDLQVFYEMKFSESGQDKNKLNHGTVQDKASSLQAQIEESQVRVGERNLDVKNCVFVVVAHRDVTGKLKEKWHRQKKDFDFPIILFSRENLLKRYGKTLSLLCSFVSNYSSRNHHGIIYLYKCIYIYIVYMCV